MRMAAHFALMEVSILLTVIRITHIIHLIDVGTCTLSEVFNRILVAEIVAALDRIEHMGLHRICRVSNGRDTIHTALCHRRSRTRRYELRHNSHLEILVLSCCQRCTHTSTTAANDQDIIGNVSLFDFFWNIVTIPAEVRTCSHNDTGCCRALYKGTT